MKYPLVSVVIPCFNGSRFVAEAIESGLSQTYPAVEVVVVDDGSKDDSRAVISSFGDRIRWKGIPNSGACHARNVGAGMARGEYLQFLDADDLLHPEKLERQITFQRSGGFDCVFCDAEVVPLVGGENPSVWKHAVDEDPVISALGSNAGTPSGLHSRFAFESISGFRRDLVAAQDRDFHLRLACSGKTFGFLEEALVTERRHDEGISSNYVRVIRQYESIVMPLCDKLIRSGQMTPKRSEAFARFLHDAARTAARLEEPLLANRLVALARSMNPAVDRASRWDAVKGTLESFGIGGLARGIWRSVRPLFPSSGR